MEKLKQAKAQCLSDIREALPVFRDTLDATDERLVPYIEDAISNEGSHANLFELLGIRKTLRLLRSYEHDPERVRRTIRAIEGVWKDGKHVKGGLKFDTPRGNQHVRLMPYQAYCIFGIYMFVTEVDMERDYHELLPTEFVRDGRVWDKRRLTQEAHLFQTRKSGKTEFGAAIDFVEVCFLGPVNGQALICANSRDQARIAYKAIREFASQVDPSCLNRMGGKYLRMTADELTWQPGHQMKGEIKVMSAGGKRKDGLYASVVHADEHGSAAYVNNSSDMQQLVEVSWGSTGPRREKLLLHTTTAGLVKDGPYKDKLASVEETLLSELDYPLTEPHRTPDDYWFALLLQLDKWEITDDLDKLNDTELFKKCNRSIGVTVQPTYYRERLHEARSSEDTKQEVLTKDMNIWLQGRVTKWITPDKIRPLQATDGRRITDCKYMDGWNVFVGLDFGGLDDLFAISYLGVDYRHAEKSQSMAGLMFADCEAWLTEEALKQSPNRQLYELWISQGWLNVIPGEVFNPDYAINALMEKQQQGVNMVMFSYDPAQSKQPINTLKAWLQSLGIDAKSIERMVIPTSQSAMTMNPLISEVEQIILSPEPWITFSASPLWPWEFGNAALETGRTDLRRVIKGGTHSGKIDNVMALLDALYGFDLSEGRIEQ